jgi:uncharacterized protein
MTRTVSAPRSGPELVFFQYLREGRFRIQRCASCDKAVFYPRVACPYCGLNDLNWIDPTGRATVYSTTCVRRRAEAGGDYNVALFDLDEGPRMMARIEGIPPNEISIGMRVVAKVVGEGEKAMVVFHPDEHAR